MKHSSLIWTAMGSLVGGAGLALLIGQLLFGAGQKTGKYTTQEEVEKRLQSVQVDQKALRVRIRQLELQSSARGAQIQGIVKKLDSVDSKLDRILYMFQRRPRVWKGRRASP